MDSVVDSVKRPSGLRFEELGDVFELFCKGRPKPSANAVGLLRPAIPNGTSSRVAMKSARHSAGGNRWKKLRTCVVILGRVESGEMV